MLHLVEKDLYTEDKVKNHPCLKNKRPSQPTPFPCFLLRKYPLEKKSIILSKYIRNKVILLTQNDVEQ
jgi:hypothetical protein